MSFMVSPWETFLIDFIVKVVCAFSHWFGGTLFIIMYRRFNNIMRMKNSYHPRLSVLRQGYLLPEAGSYESLEGQFSL